MAAENVERRKDERLPCQIRCQVQNGRKPVDGLIRDVSQGGLSLQATVQVDQGDVVRLLIPREGQRPELYLEAIVWYDRVVRSRRSGKTSQVLGLLLSDAPDSYLDLLESLRSATTPRPQRPSASEPRPSIEIEFDAQTDETPPLSKKPKQRTLPKPKRFQVRVKLSAKPRTRSIMVFADSADEARELALSEAGDGWIVLEVGGLE